LPTTRLDLSPVPRPRDLIIRGDVSAFLNYAVQGSNPGGLSGFEELGMSFDKKLLYTGISQTPTGISRGLSNFTVDEPSAMRRWVFGDGFGSTGSLGGSALVGGIGVSRDFSLDPYFVRAPLPRVQGAALTPSMLDVYVNGVLVRREPLPPGPFEIANLPVTNGLSGVRYVVEDAFGRTQEYNSRRYASPSLLAKDVSDYSYTVGFRRDGFGSDSFQYQDTPVLLAQHRLGLTDSVTAGYRLDADTGMLSLGPSFSTALPFGQIDAEFAGSVSDHRPGGAASLAYNFSVRRYSLGASLRAFTAGYSNASMRPRDDRSLLESNVFATAAVGNRLTLTLDYSATRSRDFGVGDILQLRADFRITRQAGFFLTASRSRLAGVDPSLGIVASFLYTFDNQTMANSSVTQNASEHVASLGAQRNLPVGTGFGYQVQADTGSTDRFASTVQAQGPYGRYEASFQRLGSENAATASVSGAMVLIGDRVLFSRAVQDSYALLRVPGVSGVHGFANNMDVGTTDSHGDLLIPNMLPYYGNRLSIRDSDIPIDYEIGKLEQVVASPYRGGALVAFDVHRIQTVTGVVEVAGKGAPSYGDLQIQSPGKSLESPVGGDGRFYLEGVPAGKHVARVEFKGGACNFDLVVPAEGGSTLDVGTVTCAPERGVAMK
jgi:outer membrane usher protein